MQENNQPQIDAIVRVTEKHIEHMFGVNVRLICISVKLPQHEGPIQLLEVIALSQGMHALDYKNTTRFRPVVDLKKLGALILKETYPDITLTDIGKLMSGSDHTVVLNQIEQAKNHLQSDEIFISKYHKAKEFVAAWMHIIKKESHETTGA